MIIVWSSLPLVNECSSFFTSCPLSVSVSCLLLQMRFRGFRADQMPSKTNTGNFTSYKWHLKGSRAGRQPRGAQPALLSLPIGAELT